MPPKKVAASSASTKPSTSKGAAGRGGGVGGRGRGKRAAAMTASKNIKAGRDKELQGDEDDGLDDSTILSIQKAMRGRNNKKGGNGKGEDSSPASFERESRQVMNETDEEVQKCVDGWCEFIDNLQSTMRTSLSPNPNPNPNNDPQPSTSLLFAPTLPTSSPEYQSIKSAIKDYERFCSVGMAGNPAAPSTSLEGVGCVYDEDGNEDQNDLDGEKDGVENGKGKGKEEKNKDRQGTGLVVGKGGEGELFWKTVEECLTLRPQALTTTSQTITKSFRKSSKKQQDLVRLRKEEKVRGLVRSYKKILGV